MFIRAISLSVTLALLSTSAANCVTSDSINIADYANPSDEAGLNTTHIDTAFADAVSQNKSVYCPDGASYFVNSLAIPSGLSRLYGHCNLTAGPTITTNTAVLFVSGNTQGLLVEDINITALRSAAPTATGTITSGMTMVTSLSSTTGLVVGLLVSGLHIATGSVISAVGTSSITLTLPATGSSTSETMSFYYNVDAIQITNSSNVTIRNTILNGRYGLFAYPGSGGTNNNMRYVGNTINAYALRGIESFNNATDQFFTISDNLVFGGITGSVIGVAADGGTGYTISGNRVYGANVFGIEISGVINQAQQFAVTGNTTMYTKHEGINVQGASYGTICNNTLNFGSDSVDGGLSIFADTGQVVADVVICNNQIYSPGAFGIDISSYPTVAMSAAGTVTRVSVTGNQITNPYSNLPDETFGACIDLLAEGITFVMVADNNCVMTSIASLSRTKYIVAEFLGRTTSTPDYNRLGFNPGKGMVGSQRVLGASSIITNPSLVPITTFGSLPPPGPL